mmetsp:Transcript_12710/g.21580  ORF Transcript_12710/g.21580 Transcript_12710/m.21580 type:complete len:201 (+) Transcript_12710:1078-1680(+)
MMFNSVSCCIKKSRCLCCRACVSTLRTLCASSFVRRNQCCSKQRRASAPSVSAINANKQSCCCLSVVVVVVKFSVVVQGGVVDVGWRRIKFVVVFVVNHVVIVFRRNFHNFGVMLRQHTCYFIEIGIMMIDCQFIILILQSSNTTHFADSVIIAGTAAGIVAEVIVVAATGLRTTMLAHLVVLLSCGVQACVAEFVVRVL